MGLHVFTSIAANYLPKARVLCESIRKFHPEATIHVVLCDRMPPGLDVASEPFDHLLTLDRLPLPDHSGWIFQHDLVELSTAVKGFMLDSLLARDDCDRVLYFDPDIVLFSSLHGLLKHFDDASILLTTHQSEPEKSYGTVRDNELLTLQHGVYNLGFLGVKNSATGKQFARWWGERLRYFCFDDIPSGLFVDQRWPDLVPSFFPDHKILRDPQYNVAGWNLTQRQVEGSLEKGFTVGGEPIVFMHFSGIDTGRDLEMLNLYVSSMPAYDEIREWYLDECTRHGETVFQSIPWAYGYFENGEPIVKAHRVRYRQNPDLQSRYPNPFRAFPPQLTPAVAPAEEREIPTEPYRIFLIAAPADEPYLTSTLESLRANTHAFDRVHVVAREERTDVPTIVVEALRYEDFAAHVLSVHAQQDIILLRAGATVPPLWDLRLAYTAARQSSAITISPLDRRTLDDSGTLSSLDAEYLDRLAYVYRLPDELDTAVFNRDCVYIRAAGVRGLRTKARQVRMATLLDEAPRERWQHLLTTHLCVSFRSPLQGESLPDHTVASNAFGRMPSSFLAQTHYPNLRNALRSHLDLERSHQATFYVPRRVTSALGGATLHVSHNWGGGIEHWLLSFAEEDANHDQLVLRSAGPRGKFGARLELYRYGAGEPRFLHAWDLSPAIRATAVSHAQYRSVLGEIEGSYDIGRLIVSSLIGHSLDALQTNWPTVYVCHDYYPLCPAINLHFGEVCRSCEAPRLAACLEENPLNQNFPNVVASEWLILREYFHQALTSRAITLVAPSRSSRENFLYLRPDLADSMRVVPHGVIPLAPLETSAPREPHASFHLLILGSLLAHKGEHLFRAVLEELVSFADITLAGCGEVGRRFAGHPRVRVIPEYRREDLPRIVAELSPSAGVLLSVWPETFSYTLRELQSLGVPPVATRVGAFVDSIEDGVTGFLCEPEALAVINRLKHLAGDSAALQTVRENLAELKQRSVKEMVADYRALLPDQLSSLRYFGGAHAPDAHNAYAFQLYWSDDSGAFSEANSYQFAPFHLDRQNVRLHIPPVAFNITGLRLDPGSTRGLVEIHGLRLITTRGDVLWWCEDLGEQLQSMPHAALFALRDNLLCITGDDAQMYLPIPAESLLVLRDSGGYLEVIFSWRPLSAQAEGIFEELRKETECAQTEARNIESQCLSQRLDYASQVEVLSREKRELEFQHDQLLQSHSWRVTKPLRSLANLKRRLNNQS